MRNSLAAAQALSEGLPARDLSHIEVFRLLFSGQGAAALTAIRAHLDTWARDALVLSLAANQGGLIGMSGLAGREQELASFLSGLATITATIGGSMLIMAWRFRKSASTRRRSRGSNDPWPNTRATPMGRTRSRIFVTRPASVTPPSRSCGNGCRTTTGAVAYSDI